MGVLASVSLLSCGEMSKDGTRRCRPLSFLHFGPMWCAPSSRQRNNLHFMRYARDLCLHIIWSRRGSLCGQYAVVDLRRGPDAQATLEAAENVIDNIILNYTDQLLPAGAIVAFPFEDAPKALHWAVVNALSHPGHALSNASRGQLVMKDLGGIGAAPGRCGAGDGRRDWLPEPDPECGGPGRRRWYPLDGEGNDPPVTQAQNGT